MLEHLTVLEVGARPAAVIHITVPRDQVQAVMGPAFQEAMAALAAQGLTPAGPWFTHHLRFDPEVFDFELGLPVAAPFVPTGRVAVGGLPAARVAQAVYVGGYEGLGEAWAAFDAWVAEQGLTPAGDLWERYVAGPESNADPARWRTELNRPLLPLERT